MITTNRSQMPALDQFTKRSVRAFWMDGLWDLVIAGFLLIIAIWGWFYMQFVAFPNWTWPFLRNSGQLLIWLGLLVAGLGLTVYIWVMWRLVRRLKNRLITPYTGYAEHSFFLPIDPKVFIWYALIYFTGLALLYGLFFWIRGGLNLMSIPFIISPAAMLAGVGWFYRVRRYLWIAGMGLVLSLMLEMTIITQADYFAGPRNFVNTLPQWGCPTLPCLVWAGLFVISGLIGLIRIRRGEREANPEI